MCSVLWEIFKSDDTLSTCDPSKNFGKIMCVYTGSFQKMDSLRNYGLNSERHLNTRQTVGCGIPSSLLALRVDLRGLRSKLSWIRLTFSSDTRGRPELLPLHRQPICWPCSFGRLVVNPAPPSHIVGTQRNYARLPIESKAKFVFVRLRILKSFSRFLLIIITFIICYDLHFTNYTWNIPCL